MMQAIQTRFIPPTDRKGSRVSARADAGRIIVNWKYALDVEGNHRAAAEALAARLGWTGRMIGGGLPDGSFAWVFDPEAPR
jgi:hypothetical protein